MKTIGIVLAGGLSRRFGSPKAFAKLNGKHFYEYAVEALVPYCDKITIVTRPEFVDRFSKRFTVITDEPDYFGEGPLAGIYSAMKNEEAMRYIVLPCDMPYMKASLIGKLIEYAEENIIAVKLNGQFHPLVSIWPGTILKDLKNTLDQKQLRVTPFLESIQVRWIDGDLLAKDSTIRLKNINRQIDFERGEKR